MKSRKHCCRVAFIRAGFELFAHVESDQAACFTLRTRMKYHWLKALGCEEIVGGLSQRSSDPSGMLRACSG